MTIRIRDFSWERDFESIRDFLIEAFRTGKFYRNWIPSMFENMKFGPGGTEYLDEEDENVKIWEDIDESQKAPSRIVAVSIVKPSGECWIHIHPDYTSVEREIVLWIGDRIREMKTDKHDKIEYRFVVNDYNEERIALLSELGFQKSEIEGVNQVRPTDLPVPEYQLPNGYTIRNAVIEKDFLKYQTVQKAVFPHIRTMSKKLLQIYCTASFYHEDLDVVAVDPDGNFAAFCTARLDPVSRIAELEPVGTHPEYRKLGLAKAVICESLVRLERYRPSAIVILGAAPTEGANRLYESVEFENKGARHIWHKKV